MPAATDASTRCVARSATDRSTPSSSPSPTCRAGCRASASTPATSSTTSLEHGTEGCNYLLAVDVEMNTVDGYAISSWERGYGDFVMAPDLDTLRARAVAAGHRHAARRRAMARRHRRWSSRRARSCSASSTGWPSAAGPPTSAPSSSSSCSTTPTSRPGTSATRGLTPANQYNVDYSILGTSRVEPLLRAIRLGMRDAGMQVESAKGECNLGQHEIAFRYADALTTCDNHVDLQDRRQGDRGPARAAR